MALQRRLDRLGRRLAALDPRFLNVVLGLLGVIGWVGIALLTAAGWAHEPPSAGFDLELILEAGRRVAAGETPYDPAMLAGRAPEGQTLFFSYPPPVAQAASLIGGLPSQLVHAIFEVGAVGTFAAVAVAIVRRVRPAIAALPVALAASALAAWCFPWSTGLVFGNVSAWLPAVYGLLLLAAWRSPEEPARRWLELGAGVSLAIISLKLQPASLGLWVLLRARRGNPERTILLAAAVMGAAILAASLAVGGLGPWQDYVAILRVGSGSDVVDPRNLGPASMLIQAFGADPQLAGTLQIPVTLAALAITAWAALRRRDPVESLAIAAAASLITLPVSWYHYGAAMLPFGAAAAARGRGELVVAALGLALMAPAVSVLAVTWVPIVMVVAATAPPARRPEPGR